MPAKAGIQSVHDLLHAVYKTLDSGFRRNDAIGRSARIASFRKSQLETADFKKQPAFEYYPALHLFA